jgi:colanic acid/amylovoran biosynthesis protein
MFFYYFSKSYLNYPQKILVREYDGIKYLKQFRNKNIIRTYDSVLYHSEYNISNILRNTNQLRNYSTKQNSVCVVPDIKLIERADPEKIYSIYYYLIKNLNDSKKFVYLLSHSIVDYKICKEIKSMFNGNKMVILVSEDLNVFEIEMLIKKFDFIIASRYHSIIHAYKNGIPALVIGWAIKYIELLTNYNQSEYYFDIRSNLDLKIIIHKLEKMIKSYNIEKKKISLISNNLRKQNFLSKVI